MRGWILRRPVSFLTAATVVTAACGSRTTESTAPGAISFSTNPTTVLASSPELLALGKKTFEKECLACHGAAGNGEGDAAYLLYPRPRDFTTGQFRIISTWDGVPTDERSVSHDLARHARLGDAVVGAPVRSRRGGGSSTT